MIMRLSTDIRLYTHTFSYILSIEDHHTITHKLPWTQAYTGTFSVQFLTLSLSFVSHYYSLVSAGHTRHTELQTYNTRLFFGPLLVVFPFQLTVALLSALGAAAALYSPLRVGAL